MHGQLRIELKTINTDKYLTSRNFDESQKLIVTGIVHLIHSSTILLLPGFDLSLPPTTRNTVWQGGVESNIHTWHRVSL